MADPPPNRLTGHPLQPIVPVVEADVEQFVGTWESDRLRQLEADQGLLDQLMFRSYRGREWDEFCDVLLRYGISTPSPKW